MFERPLLLWLLILAPLVVAPGLLAIRRGKIAAGVGAAMLRLASFTALVLALAGLGLMARGPASRVDVIAMVDGSRSIAPDQEAWIRHQVRDLASALRPRDRLGVLAFGRDAKLLSPLGDPRFVSLKGVVPDRGATDIASALGAASSLFSSGAEKRIVLLTDGNQTVGDLRDEMAAIIEQGVRVYPIIPPPTSTERVALTGFAGPSVVRANQRFAFHLAIENEADHPVSVGIELMRSGEPLGRETVRLRPGLNRFNLPYRMHEAGAYVMQARMKVSASLVMLNSQIDAPLTVKAPPRVLIVATTPPQSVMRALRLRHYRVEIASPRALPDRAHDYLSYQTVVVADASAKSLSAGAQRALNRYVANLGGGLIVTGNTLRDDRFAGGSLEKALPVRFSRQPPPPTREPIAVYLLIDRSNSMSYDSRYPAVRDNQRIRYAKAAAIALLHQLDDTDYVGVIAFDSQPYVLSHLEPLGTDRKELENRIERLEPGGGTDFLASLEIAEREILNSKIPVRQVILLTDGDTNRPYHDHDKVMASYAQHHIPLSTIRIGPDLANLRLLKEFAHVTGGTFYRVHDIEKLPLLMVGLTREAMKMRERGRTRIVAGAPSAILTGIAPASIPSIDYYALSKPKDGAQVPLKVVRGKSSTPLLAAWQYGLGRSAILAVNPDSLASLEWIKWNRYAEFWSQLVTWTMRRGDSGPFTLQVKSSPDGAIRIEAESAGAEAVGDLALRIKGDDHAMEIPMTQVNQSLYRGEVGPLAPGTYTATLISRGMGDVERTLDRCEFASVGAVNPDAAELRIRPPDVELMRRIATETGGVLDASMATVAKPAGAMVEVRRSAEPYLLPLAILLFLGEVFIRRRVLAE